jgi:AcrR family transcriptional regulator
VQTRADEAGEMRDHHEDQDQSCGDDPNNGQPVGPGWWPVSRGSLPVAHGSGGKSLWRQGVSVKSDCINPGHNVYSKPVPKLWNETIESHRKEVRDAVLDTTAKLVAEHGLRSVTMSQIAGETGIGRATLYKYFSDVEAILHAWHDREITAHLAYLADVRDRAGNPVERLEAVLEAFAEIARESHGHHDTELAAFLHRDERVPRAEQQLRRMIRDLVAEGAKSGKLRNDVPPEELAGYCLHALAAAKTLSSKAAVGRLVEVTLAGLRRAR